MAETPRYRATPQPKFLTTAYQIPRSIWRTTKVAGVKIGNLARRFGHWVKLKTARPVLATDRGVRRAGRWLWNAISAAPTYAYRGMGYVARAASFLVKEVLAVVAIAGLVLALIGVVAAKTSEAYDNVVHESAISWSQGKRMTYRAPAPVVDADGPNYHADDDETEAQEIIDTVSKATGLSHEQIVDALKGTLKTTVPEGARPGTREDADKYPILERMVPGPNGEEIWQELRYDDVDSAVRDQQARQELYLALTQMDAREVRRRWEMMKEVARIREDLPRAAYYNGRELAVGQFITAAPHGDILKMTPQQMVDILSVDLDKNPFTQHIRGHEVQFRNGIKHEWARIRDHARHEAEDRKKQQRQA